MSVHYVPCANCRKLGLIDKMYESNNEYCHIDCFSGIEGILHIDRQNSNIRVYCEIGCDVEKIPRKIGDRSVSIIAVKEPFGWD